MPAVKTKRFLPQYRALGYKRQPSEGNFVPVLN